MLSIIILTKNSEPTLADCIEKVRPLADELLVVDSGSSDRTQEIAKMLGAHVVEHDMKDFADQRNFALKQAKGDWVLYLDSDEFATKKFCDEVRHVIKNYPEDAHVAGYFIQRKTYYLGRDWGIIDQVQRLFYVPKFIEWYGAVHETPKVKGSLGTIHSPINHYTHWNLSQMLNKTNEWSEHEARLRFDANHPKMTPLRFVRVIATGFLSSYFKNNGYKNGTEGMIESIYQGYSMFVTYAKLWEMQNKKGEGVSGKGKV